MKNLDMDLESNSNCTEMQSGIRDSFVGAEDMQEVDCVQLDDEFSFDLEQFWNLLLRNLKEKEYGWNF